MIRELALSKRKRHNSANMKAQQLRTSLDIQYREGVSEQVKMKKAARLEEHAARTNEP